MIMQFFLPFWQADKIHPFNPWAESKGKKLKRLWQVFLRPPLDGLLISRINIDKSKSFREEIISEGIHKALNFDGKIICDCGAFGYADREKPIYNPKETLDFYLKIGVNAGVSVDHLIFSSTEKKDERFKLTIKNAEIMLNKLKNTENKKFQLIGVAQGWDINSYKRAVKKLIEKGFDYIAFGGLVRSSTKFIEELLQKVGPTIQKNKIKMHLFGVARESLFPLMQKYVFSFDSASYLRRAWLSMKNNYHLDEKQFTAIRISIAKNEKEKKLEKKVFAALRNFENGKINAKKFIGMLNKYDPERVKILKDEYLRTLTEKPWEKCDCPVCKELGIHICIFRGNERNMRRGYHNVYHFYNRIQEWKDNL